MPMIVSGDNEDVDPLGSALEATPVGNAEGVAPTPPDCEAEGVANEDMMFVNVSELRNELHGGEPWTTRLGQPGIS